MLAYVLRHPAVCQYLAEVRDHGQRHGSRLRDLLVEAGHGSTCDAADDWLGRLEAGLLTRSERAWPTPSQAAWTGMGRGSREHPGWVAGCREHYCYGPGQILAVDPADSGPAP